MNYNTIIIGAGIGGMTAAIYLKRANKSVMILEKEAPGGQLLRTSIVENYPGVKSKEGSEIAVELYEQIRQLEIPIYFEEVIKIDQEDDKNIVTTIQNQYTCKNIIIATGRMYRKLNIENEDRLTGRGISYCAICDGALYKNKNVAVVGAGNSAFEETLYLSNLCNKVTILARRNDFRATNNLISAVKKKENIEIKTNVEVEKLIGKQKLEKLILKDKNTNKQEELTVDGCFIYIGQDPETKIFESIGLKIENGYIITNSKMKTNLKNIYACGDCRKKSLYQLVTATYDGAVAANEIIKQKEKDRS